MRRRGIAALLTLALGVSACAYYDDYGAGWGPAGGYRYGDYVYDGRAFGREGWDAGTMRLSGPGADILDPWLALTNEGRDVLALGFDMSATGGIGEDTAHRANIWFRRYADSNRDMRLTDEEIRIALVQASRGPSASGY